MVVDDTHDVTHGNHRVELRLLLEIHQAHVSARVRLERRLDGRRERAAPLLERELGFGVDLGRDRGVAAVQVRGADGARDGV